MASDNKSLRDRIAILENENKHLREKVQELLAQRKQSQDLGEDESHILNKRNVFFDGSRMRFGTLNTESPSFQEEPCENDSSSSDDNNSGCIPETEEEESVEHDKKDNVSFSSPNVDSLEIENKVSEKVNNESKSSGEDTKTASKNSNRSSPLQRNKQIISCKSFTSKAFEKVDVQSFILPEKSTSAPKLRTRQLTDHENRETQDQSPQINDFTPAQLSPHNFNQRRKPRRSRQDIKMLTQSLHLPAQRSLHVDSFDANVHFALGERKTNRYMVQTMGRFPSAIVDSTSSCDTQGNEHILNKSKGESSLNASIASEPENQYSDKGMEVINALNVMNTMVTKKTLLRIRHPETSDKYAFQQFFLLSINHHTVQVPFGSGFFNEGYRYLDPFILKSADCLDRYPSQVDCNGFDPSALTAFCCPDGIKVRLIPRSGFARARRLRMIGKRDQYKLLSFTDESGTARHGIAISIIEKANSDLPGMRELIKSLHHRRKKRVAGRKICHWWTTLMKKQKQCAVQMGYRSDLGKRRQTSFSLGHALNKIWQSNKTCSLDDSSQSSCESLNSGVNRGGLDKSNVDVAGAFLTGPQDGIHQRNRRRKSSGDVTDRINQDRFKITHKALNSSYVAGGHSLEERKQVYSSTQFSEFGTGAEMAGNESTFSNTQRADSSCDFLDWNGNTHQTLNEPADNTSLVEKIDSSSGSKQVKTKSHRIGAKPLEAVMTPEAFHDVCIIEKCFVMIGGPQSEQFLQLHALQNMIELEREEKANSSRRNSLKTNAYVRKESKNFDKSEKGSNDKRMESKLILDFRRQYLQALQINLRLSPEQSRVRYPKGKFGVATNCKFEVNLPTITSTAKMSIPLPLPHVTGHWGTAAILSRLKPYDLLLIFKLLLIERSILVIGDSSELVTSCTFALLELMKPFEWAGPFMPILPGGMIDFINSPVPFLIGMVSENPLQLEKNYQICDAMSMGLSVVNLSTGMVHITNEAGIKTIIRDCPVPKSELSMLKRRLEPLRKKSLSMRSFAWFAKNGLSREEVTILDGVRTLIRNFLRGLAGNIALNPDGWRQYGKFAENGEDFDFYPSLYTERLERQMKSLECRLQFQRMMVYSQLFVEFVDSQRKISLTREKVSKVIADWAARHWRLRVQMKKHMKAKPFLLKNGKPD